MYRHRAPTGPNFPIATFARRYAAQDVHELILQIQLNVIMLYLFLNIQ